MNMIRGRISQAIRTSTKEDFAGNMSFDQNFFKQQMEYLQIPKKFWEPYFKIEQERVKMQNDLLQQQKEAERLQKFGTKYEEKPTRSLQGLPPELQTAIGGGQPSDIVGAATRAHRMVPIGGPAGTFEIPQSIPLRQVQDVQSQIKMPQILPPPGTPGTVPPAQAFQQQRMQQEERPWDKIWKSIFGGNK